MTKPNKPSNPKAELLANMKMQAKLQSERLGVKTAEVGGRQRFKKAPQIKTEEPLLFKNSSCFNKPLSVEGAGKIPKI